MYFIQTVLLTFQLPRLMWKSQNMLLLISHQKEIKV